MAAKRQIILYTIQIEGGFVDNPLDPGGATNKGITKNSLENYLGRSVTLQELKDLDNDTAIDFYDTQVWKPFHCDDIPEELQHIAFDMAVNHGFKLAAKILQRATYALGFDVIVDGVLGPKTITTLYAAITKFGVNEVMHGIIDQREGVYRSIVKQHPNEAIFLNGWLHRNSSFLNDPLSK